MSRRFGLTSISAPYKWKQRHDPKMGRFRKRYFSAPCPEASSREAEKLAARSGNQTGAPVGMDPVSLSTEAQRRRDDGDSSPQRLDGILRFFDPAAPRRFRSA